MGDSTEELKYYFREGDTVRYTNDDPWEEDEWGTVLADAPVGSTYVRVDWRMYPGVPSLETPASLVLVKPAGYDGSGIVPPYVLDKIEGHEGDKPDMVNSPPHYNQHPKGIECIDVIEDNPFILLGNAMKYLWRVSWGGKGNDTEDLEKAIWYIQRELKRRENAES